MNAAPIEFKWGLLLLIVLILVPSFLFIVAKFARGFSFGSFLALMAAVIAGGVLLVLLAVVLPVVVYQERRQSSAVYQKHSEPPAGSVLETPIPAIVDRPLLPQDSFSEAPLVARKPYDPKAEIPVPAAVQEGHTLELLPDWVVSGLENTKQNEHNLLESSKPVFQSGLFATREDALYDALSKAMEHLQANLMLRYPRFKINMWKLNPDLLRHTAYRRVYYQTVEHDFGNVLKSGEPFKQDMYRAYLEVEDSPPVRKMLFTKWRQNIGNERVAWLGGGFGLMTLLCAGVAVYLRVTHH
ncbi:hypothetical protein [uncultured Gimesia sp.]|mgnify:CR=1 FL=1|uniref:hypothetical protein n=1 Tax=uncultured Gimesia sp. TaxID=1678688 RepID=UPI0030DCA742|tara:strand:+ start:4807 stop:5700 length:894 start_codon:yes stop_codon:yes gene_type:complete